MVYLEKYITELMVGGMLSAFAFMFRAWMSGLQRSLEKIFTRLDRITTEFHAHTVDDATMWARIDADLKSLYKRFDREIGEIQRKVDANSP